MICSTRDFQAIRDGLRMPAEWSRHAATLMTWPSNRNTWPGDRLERVRRIVIRILRKLIQAEPVLLLVQPGQLGSVKTRLRRELDMGPLRLLPMTVNDFWIRDCGPVTVLDDHDESGSLYLMTDWDYNAWGEKYPPWQDDNLIPSNMADLTGLPLIRPGMVLEGGAVDTNGEGTFLTTESVLLNPNRNPGSSREEISQVLEQYLGAEQILWLKGGLAGDDTDGHVDGVARFLNRNSILAMISEDPDSPNFEMLLKNLNILETSLLKDGTSPVIERLPMPPVTTDTPTVDDSGHVPASYANFYITNRSVLLPLYDPQTDRQAFKLFENYFPGREIVGIPAGDLVWGQGSIHCITQPLYGFNPEEIGYSPFE